MMGLTPRPTVAVTPRVNGAAAHPPTRGAVPETNLDRVLTILREANRTMTIAQIRDEYQARAWPAPSSGTLYNAIGGAVAYLAKKKKSLVRNKDGYALSDGSELL